jgi:hypothetical protein
MAGKIFINYRRGDDPGFTMALYQRLEQEFPAGDLFMDIEGHIKPGDNFVAVLNQQVAALGHAGPRCWPHTQTPTTISSPSKSRQHSTRVSA